MERRGKEGEGSYPVVIDEMEEDHPGGRKL